MPTRERLCRTRSIWAVMDSFGMDLARILHSCEILKVYPPAVPTVVDLVSSLLFSLNEVYRRYMDFFPLSATPESLSFFHFLGGGR